ncbi:E3 SUMO-protein ligase ZBED1-like [Leptinotarsa decemlineata]|uniref:E3 SUMO-protein ligase ZBED1-like n=1 Tax=Leptinotarsa decemlineata TaxID=7539 RepID=UPI003D306260
MSSRRTTGTSLVWNHFVPKPGSDVIAICNICKMGLSYKSSSNNLKKHMLRKHPLVKMDTERCEPSSQPSQSCSQEPLSGKPFEAISSLKEVSDNLHQKPSTSGGKKSQTVVTNFVRKKIGLFEKKKLDSKLMQLFIKDFQPLSIVEDDGFKEFVQALNPSYQLPSRKTVSTSFLNGSYEQIYNEMKHLMKMSKAVTLTTDCWTSRNTENFLAVTAHFINKNFRLKSVLLECISFGERHTGENLGAELKKIISEWELDNKILMVVSDNASNIKKAIIDSLKLKHFGCYAHTVNLIVIDALRHIYPVSDKLKTIVAFFKRSTTATAKFQEQQVRLNGKSKKLIQDVATRWNSTFYMFERFSELEEPIRTTMALLDKDLPIICQEEWEFLKEIVEILRPMENVTNIMSGESYLTASSVIVLSDGLINIYEEMNKNKFTYLSEKVITCILEGLRNRLGSIENNNLLTMSTFLDPRFKILGFSNDQVCDRVKKSVISHVTHVINVRESQKENTVVSGNDSPTLKADQPNKTDQKFSIWKTFEKKKSTFSPVGTAHSKAIIEVQRYVDEPPIPREEDPLEWWRKNAYNFPNLSELVKEKCVTVATSVPCERLFSKSGLMLSDRRNRLSCDKVKKLLFLNSNSNLCDGDIP